MEGASWLSAASVVVDGETSVVAGVSGAAATAGTGGAGAGAASAAVTPSPMTTASFSPSGTTAWATGRARSMTTRVMSSGEVWNCETRTRVTSSPWTAIDRWRISFFTPGRSRTMRGGFASTKSFGENHPSPSSVTETRPPVESTETFSRAWAVSPRAAAETAGTAGALSAGAGAASGVLATAMAGAGAGAGSGVLSASLAATAVGPLKAIASPCPTERTSGLESGL